MAERLSGRRIVLTGVSRGVGLASARLLLDEGAELLGVARDAERLARIEAELEARAPGRFTALSGDLTEPATRARLVELVASRWGALDVLVNNAGVQLGNETVTREPLGTLERSLDVNLLAPYHASRALLPLLLEGSAPRVVHVSSGAGTFAALAEDGIGAYRLSKWALNGLTLLQAREWRGQVSVVAFDPGWVKTELGGPNAPGVPEESAAGLLEALLMPSEVTGLFFKDGREIEW